MANRNKALDPTKTPTALDIAWAAGIYEGEGSCSFARTTYVYKGAQVRTAEKKGKPCITAYLSVCQKDPEILYRLRDWFGGSVRPFKWNDRRFHRWTLHGRRIVDFAQHIYPFLSVRRKAQLDKVLNALPGAVETMCHAPSAKAGEDIVRAVQECTEVGGNVQPPLIN